MARRSSWDEFAKGFGLGQRMVEQWNDTQLRDELRDAGKTDEIQYDRYTPEQAAQIEANAKAGVENPYEGLTPAAKRFSFAGVDRDKAFSDVEKDGLRAASMASVYDKHGRPEQAMQMRSLARQMNRDARQDAYEAAEEAVWKKGLPESDDELIKLGVEQYGKNMGVGGIGKNKDATLDVVPMESGNYRITQYSGDTAVGAKDMSREELISAAKDYLQKNQLLELARANPQRWMPTAIQVAQTDRQFANTLNQQEWARKHAEAVLGESRTQHEWQRKHANEQITLQQAEIGERRAERKARESERRDARKASAEKELRERMEKGGAAVQKFAMENIPELWSADSDGKQRVDEKAAREFNDFIQRTGGIKTTTPEGKDVQVPWDQAMAANPAATKAALRNQFALYYLNSARSKAMGQTFPDTDVKAVRDSRDSDWGIGQKSGLGLGAGLNKSIFGGKVIELKDGTVLDYEATMKSPYGPMVLSYLKANGLLSDDEINKPSLKNAQSGYVPLPGEMSFVR